MSTEQQEKFFWLDEFLESLERAIGYMDLSTLLPTSWRHFQPLIAKEWLVWFWRIIEQRKTKNISFVDLSKVFEPDLCREHLLFTLEDLKTARWPIDKRLEVADFFYQTLKSQMPQGDLFGLNGSTKRHSKYEVSEIMKESFIDGTPEMAKDLGKLYNGAYNLGAALFLDFYMGKAVENWGPYELGNNKILVIKKMRNLKSSELYRNIGTICNEIDLYAVYEGVHFFTDLIACHTRYEGDVINSLKRWRLEVDSCNITDLDTIKKIGLNLAQISEKQWIYLTNLPEAELLEKAVWIRCYCFKEMCELLGLDWRPTKELLESVKGKTLLQGWRTWKQPKNESKYKKYWRDIWDPREEVYPN